MVFKLMKKVSEFKKKLQSLDIHEECIEYYASLYDKIEDPLLDKNYISKISDLDTLKQRLSELVIIYTFSEFDDISISGREDGPDLIIDNNGKKINIEIVTPLKIDVVDEKFKVLNSNDGQTSKYISMVEDRSLRTRVSSTFKSKVEQFDRWIKKGIVKENDINIILINLGFVDHIINEQLKNLRHVFYADVNTIIDCTIDSNLNNDIPVRVEPYNTKIKKNITSPTILTQSYFDSDEINTNYISGVIIMQTKEHFNNKYRMNGIGSLYKNEKAKIQINNELDFLSRYIIDVPKYDYFTKQLMKTGKITRPS